MGKSHHVAAVFIHSFTVVGCWKQADHPGALQSWDGFVFFCLTVVRRVGSGGWQHPLGQALHLVRDVASAGPLGWKTALDME